MTESKQNSILLLMFLFSIYYVDVFDGWDNFIYYSITNHELNSIAIE